MGLWVTAGERRCVEMMKMTTMVQQARLVGEMTRLQLLPTPGADAEEEAAAVTHECLGSW